MTTPLTGAVNQIELTIGGMTCASCAARIERKLNRVGLHRTGAGATGAGRDGPRR